MKRPALSHFTVKKTRTIGFCVAALGALLMSLDPVFIRYAGVSGFDTAFLFGLFTAISIPIVLQLNDKRGLTQAVKESGWPLLFSGVLMLGSASGLVFSIMNTSIANTFVIISGTPALAAVFSWLFLRESTSRSTWLAIVSVMVGIAIVVSGSFGPGNWIGDALAVFSTVCLALMFTLQRKHQNVSRMASVGLGGFLLATVMFLFATPSAYSASTWVIMGIMGLFTAPVGRVFSMVATRYITAAEVSMTLMIETILAPIWAFIFFSEVPALTSIFGGLIILITIAFYTFSTLNNEH
ncbi:MAG: DMT family transporter [Endozoicomonas sp.]